MIKSIQSPDNEPQPVLLGVRNVARLLDCSTRHVYRMSDSGRMPRLLKIGAMVRWKASDIREWIADGCPDCRTDEQRATRPAANKKTNRAAM